MSVGVGAGALRPAVLTMSIDLTQLTDAHGATVQVQVGQLCILTFDLPNLTGPPGWTVKEGSRTTAHKWLTPEDLEQPVVFSALTDGELQWLVIDPSEVTGEG